MCRWRGAKLKAEAKAKRREECSTKGACVLQLGLCVCVRVCVFVDGLECLCHGASQTFACEGCPKIDKHRTTELPFFGGEEKVCPVLADCVRE